MSDVIWNKSKRSKSKFISLMRQLAASVYDGTRLYAHVENVEGMSAGEIEACVYLAGKDAERNEFLKLVEKNGLKFSPLISSVFEYLKKHDSVWINQNSFLKEVY